MQAVDGPNSSQLEWHQIGGKTKCAGYQNPAWYGFRGKVSPVTDLAEADRLRLELRRERAAGPLADGLSGLVHGSLLASILANLGVHGIGAGSKLRRSGRLSRKLPASTSP
jgi:hypothetical protein